jgi:hypothetical protein
VPETACVRCAAAVVVVAVYRLVPIFFVIAALVGS